MQSTSNRVLSLTLVAAFALALPGCVSVGNMAAKLLTTKTADLQAASVQVRFIRNLYPTATQTTSVKAVSELWEDGSNGASIQFLKRQGVGFYEIDGTVTLNGEVIPHFGSGTYGKILSADDDSPQTFVIETTSGQRAEFTVEALPAIGIIAVNGMSEGATIDMGKSFEIELKNPPGTKGTNVGIKLLANAVGTRDFYPVGTFRSHDKLALPASIFGSSAVPNSKLGFEKGANYLLVERSANHLVEDQPVGAAQVTSWSWDTVPVTLEGEVKYYDNIKAEGEIETGNGTITYGFSKPNATTGRPLNTAKKFGLASLSVRGTLRKQEVESSSSTIGNVTTTTTTTTTWQFPPLPDAFWDQLMENLYADVAGLLKARYGITFIPVDQVTASVEYAKLEEINDENTTVEIERSYKGTKKLIPTSVSGLWGQISSTFAADRPEARLIRELGVDGLVSITLDLDLPTDTEAITLRPIIGIRITGTSGADDGAQVSYFSGGASIDKGEPVREGDAQNINALNRIVRKDDLMAAIVKGLDELEAREKELGYDLIWALKVD